MKNLYKLFGIIVLTAIIVFTMTACPGNGPGTTYANVKLRAYNNQGVAPSMSIARSAIPIAPLASAHASFNPFTTFYSKLGTKIADITPTKFIVPVTEVYFFDANGDYVFAEGGFLDFAQGTTITLNDVPAGVTCTAIRFNFGMNITGIGYESGWVFGTARVEFEWPGGKTAFDAHSKNTYTYAGGYTPGSPEITWEWGQGHLHFPDQADFGSGYNTTMLPSPAQTVPFPIPANPGFYPSWNGNKVTILMHTILPDTIKTVFEIAGYEASDNFISMEFSPSGIVYSSTETERKWVSYEEHDSSSPLTAGGAIIVPNFTPVTLPESGTVTFNVSWDLTGIISRYRPVGANADGSEDIYIIKNNYWDGLYMNITY